MGNYANDVVLPLNPIGYWRLEEFSGTTAIDLSGEDNDGTYNGPTLDAVAGPHINGPKAPTFDGTNDYVDIYSSGLAADFNGSAFTISLWMKVDSWTDGNERAAIIIKADADNFVQIAKYTTNERVWLVVKAGGVFRHYEYTVPSGIQGDWIHFAISYDAAATKMVAYANGGFVGQHTDCGVWTGSPDSDECTIGRGFGPGFYFDGAIADVAIFDSALSGTQIEEQLAVVYTETSPSGGVLNDALVRGKLEVIGQRDDPQLTVQAHTTQTEPLQRWLNSAGDNLAVVTGDGRMQIGSFDLGGAMATDDSLLEAHRDESSLLPKRALHLLGRISGALSDAVSWVVQELELLGSGGVSGIHTALRARLTFDNSGDSDMAELRAGDFEVINQAGSSGTPVGQATALRAVVTNDSGAYLSEAVGVAITISGSDIDDAYAIHATGGMIRTDAALMLPVLGSAPSVNPPSGFLKVYFKLDAGNPKLYAKDSAGTEHTI